MLEFLVGRLLRNAACNLGIESTLSEALGELGYVLEDIYEEERDPALGNGGLGRLAACFMDSLASLDLPAWGYGLHYTYGMFKQLIRAGEQKEVPDKWLDEGNPWEITRLDVVYPVRFYGSVEAVERGDGTSSFTWVGGDIVEALAHDIPIPGCNTRNCNNIRLWQSRPGNDFDLDSFNKGDYVGAVQERHHSENITSVLYPNDNSYNGKELRLKQQYFLVSATIQDILRRHTSSGYTLQQLPDFVCLQLNDTHPTLAIVELMRILVDEKHLPWEEAWSITTRVFNYTNHTVLPEALEKWSVSIIQALLPRHMLIIFDINHRFLIQVNQMLGEDIDLRILNSVSIIEEGFEKQVRMANLAIVGSSHVNGVAGIHTEILRSRVFLPFAQLFPDKFLNITNGVTQRRWLVQANRELSALITQELGGTEWQFDMMLLRQLEAKSDSAELQTKWLDVKFQKKKALAAYLKHVWGFDIDPTTMFDIQIKRIHEYKRQLLNALAIIKRYQDLKKASPEERATFVRKTVLFAGKAAPGYFNAKCIIRLICGIAEVVNADAETNHYLKVFFVPNYNVTLAEKMIPASDLSQHISTAGMEASGTSNMKFIMNGGIIIGTLDGANVEISEQVQRDNVFIFGLKTEQIDIARHSMKYTGVLIEKSFRAALREIEAGTFGPRVVFERILESVKPENDYYCLNLDFEAYCKALAAVDAAYADRACWAKKSILNVARSGTFSSDHTIRQYAEKVWQIKPCKLDNKEEGSA